MVMANKEIDEVIRIGRLASERVREVYRTPFVVEMKGPSDPVTRADREANEIICRALEASFPGMPCSPKRACPPAWGMSVHARCAPGYVCHDFRM